MKYCQKSFIVAAFLNKSVYLKIIMKYSAVLKTIDAKKKFQAFRSCVQESCAPLKNSCPGSGWNNVRFLFANWIALTPVMLGNYLEHFFLHLHLQNSSNTYYLPILKWISKEWKSQEAHFMWNATMDACTYSGLHIMMTKYLLRLVLTHFDQISSYLKVQIFCFILKLDIPIAMNWTEIKTESCHSSLSVQWEYCSGKSTSYLLHCTIRLSNLILMVERTHL